MSSVGEKATYVEHTWFVRVGQQSSEAPLFLKEQDGDADFNDAVGTQECVDGRTGE